MPEYSLEFRGWHAIVALVALIGFFGIKMYLRIRPVDDGVRDAIRAELQKEYSGRTPKELERRLEEARLGQTVEPLPPPVNHDIDFRSIDARGKLSSFDELVRADIVVDGGAPPDGKELRFFRVERVLGGGWIVVGETTSYAYSMELVPW